MNKEEFHNIVIEQQPNICQIVCYKDNQLNIVFSPLLTL